MRYFDKYLKHHGILGQKWGKLSGPPYPLGSGDHSSSEKAAAKKAGVKVGKDSGKGSIENVKGAAGSNQHAKKKPLTEEEKRLKAEEAKLKGDSKNITKYMDKMTTQELQDAQTRAQIRKNLEGPKEKKMTKSEKEIDEVIKSGDKEKVKEFATKMSYNQLQEAMNKIDMMQKLNYVPPKPTTMDKIDSAMKKVDKARDWMQKGLNAYDALAAINNTFNKDSQWPRPKLNKDNNNDNNKKKEDKFENVAKKVIGEAQESHQENVKRDEDRNAKVEAKAEKKLEKQEAKLEKKEQKQIEKQEKKDLDVTFNKYVREVDENKSKSVDEKLTANEDAMFRAISNPDAFDSNGNFNWDYYDKERNK